jgi:hypothetical protein
MQEKFLRVIEKRMLGVLGISISSIPSKFGQGVV